MPEVKVEGVLKTLNDQIREFLQVQLDFGLWSSKQKIKNQITTTLPPSPSFSGNQSSCKNDQHTKF